MTKYIYNKDSFENAVEVNNYPWGFRLKTKRRTWIETDKNKGDRVCFCTLNPKTNKWCAVKKSTYNAVDVLLIDEKDNHEYFIHKYNPPNKIKEILRKFNKNLKELKNDKKFFLYTVNSLNINERKKKIKETNIET